MTSSSTAVALTPASASTSSVHGPPLYEEEPARPEKWGCQPRSDDACDEDEDSDEAVRGEEPSEPLTKKYEAGKKSVLFEYPES